MKKPFIVLSGLLLLASVALVSWAPRSARDVAAEWLNDFYHGDYAAAERISTNETKTLLETVQQLAAMVPDSTMQAMKSIRIEVTSETIKGDTAVVMYVVSDQPGVAQPLKLVKSGESWLVLFTKNDMDMDDPDRK